MSQYLTIPKWQALPIDARIVVARMKHVSKQMGLMIGDSQPHSQSQVYDERSLFDYMCAKRGAAYGTDRLLRFFSYNFQNIKHAIPRLKSALAATNSRILN